MSIELQTRTDGSYVLNANGLNLEASVAVSLVQGPALGSLTFGTTNTQDDVVAGMSGHTASDVAESSGLRVTRQLFRSKRDGTVGVRLILRNLGDKSITIASMTPLTTRNAGAAVIADGKLPDWQIVRGSRQKNDIPGVFRPAVSDLDWSDATFGSSDIPAGQGVGISEGRDDFKHVVEADSFICIHSRAKPQAPGLFLCVLGQTEHLSQIRFVRSPDARNLQELSVIGEMDGAELPPGQERATHWVLLRESTDAWENVTQLAEWLAQDAKLAQPGLPPTIFCTWYFYGEQFTQADLDETLAALRHKRLPFDTFVIDNGWMTDFGTWEANDRFPRGMEYAAKQIADAGYRPGIWTCPFVLMDRSPILKKLPDIVARDADGKPLPFNYRIEPTTVLDPTSPPAEDYIHEMFQRMMGWGFTYHKLDFLRAVSNATRARFHDRTATRAQAYRRGMQAIRDGLGRDGYINACGGVFEAGIGLINGQRSGSDTVALWEGPADHPVRAKPLLVAKQTVFRSHMNRLWHTDPDAVMLRVRNDSYRGDEKGAHLAKGELSQEQAFTILINQYVSGGAICVAERMAQLQEDRRALLRHVIPAVTGAAQAIDLWHEDCPTLYLTHVEARDTGLDPWWTLSVTNWDEKALTREIKLSEIGLPDDVARWAVFEFRSQRFIDVVSSDATVKLNLPGFATRVLRLTPWHDQPTIVGTDLHVTGGAAELRDVKITPDRIEAKLVTEWDLPVTVTALFPADDGYQVVRSFASVNEPDVVLQVGGELAAL